MTMSLLHHNWVNDYGQTKNYIQTNNISINYCIDAWLALSSAFCELLHYEMEVFSKTF